MLTSVLLLGKIFAIAIYRRHSQSERQARSAAENLWHVRQLTTALVADTEHSRDALEDAVRDAPQDVILHLLRVQSGRHYQALLETADKQGKFAELQKSLFASDPAKALRALQRIEICKTPGCIRSVDRLMHNATRPELGLQAAWTRQRMGSPLTQGEILNIVTRCNTGRPLLHSAVAAAFARDFTGSPDLLFAAFAEIGNSNAGIEMLARINSDEALWRLLVLSGSPDPEIGRSARECLNVNRQPRSGGYLPELPAGVPPSFQAYAS